MQKDELLALQNGSDVRGVAMETDGGPAVTLTCEIAAAIAERFVGWVAQKLGRGPVGLRIGVGHDSRLTATVLKNAIIDKLVQMGAVAFDCALSSTPAMFMGCVFEDTNFDGSMMITASHLPQNRNGLKFFTKDGGVDKKDMNAILQLEPSTVKNENNAQGNVEKCGLMALYAGFLRNKIIEGAALGPKPLDGLHIVVDAGNGAGGFFVQDVLLPLGANCDGSQFLEPDGNFPNHMPNPENAEAMASVCAAVTGSKAGLGIIFDTDVDRMSAVFADGTPVNRNAIIALMAAILAPENKGATIVTDSVTSDKLTAFLEGRLGMVHHCFKRGYRNVINEAVRLNANGINSPLAIETSGHGALRENYFLDDGAYMAVRIIMAAAVAKQQGKGIEALLDGYEEPAFEAERRIKILDADFVAYGSKALEVFREQALQNGIKVVKSYEGVRLAIEGKGWVLLRMSLHDPVLPLNAEGNTEADCAEMLALADKLLGGLEKLDCSVLKV